MNVSGGRRQGDKGHAAAPPKQQRTRKEGGGAGQKKLLRDSRVWRNAEVAPPREYYFDAKMDGDDVVWPSDGTFHQSLWNAFFAQTDPRRQLVCADLPLPSSSPRALHRTRAPLTPVSFNVSGHIAGNFRSGQGSAGAPAASELLHRRLGHPPRPARLRRARGLDQGAPASGPAALETSRQPPSTR
jgi:hypothetical protein